MGIEHRGKHATGFVATTFDNKVVLDKAPVPATDFIANREKIPNGAQAILLHTRFMTQGAVENSVNNHPVIYKTCFTVHNGSIRNDDELFEQHKLTRNGEVDTEIIAAMLDKFGMDSADNVTKALSELKGHMAIAAIDPVRNPGQLLLARGEGSPLHIYHTENYIVWASEGKVIREAWAKVFGTPPEWSNIGFLPEGKFWIANGSEVKETKYEVARSWGSPLWQGRQQGGKGIVRSLYDRHKDKDATCTRTQRNGSRTGNDGRPKPWEGKDSLFITKKAFLDAVAAWREQYEGADNVRIWSHRDDYDTKDFEDVKGMLAWVPCLCGEQVLAEDTRHHVKYGSICQDCYQVIFDKYASRAASETTPMGPKEKEEPTVKVHSLPTDDRKALEEWAEVDARMNVLCIDEVCKLIDWDYNTVEYLVWRKEPSLNTTTYSKALNQLSEDIKKIYKAVEAEMWEQYGNQLLGITDEGEPDDQHIAYTVKKGDGVSELWFRCILHQEEYRAREECSKCSPQGRSVPRYACMDCGEWFPRYQVHYVNTGGETSSNYICEECRNWADSLSETTGGSCEVASPLDPTPLDSVVRCGQCASFKKRDEECRVCQKALQAAPESPQVKACYCTTVKGKPCKRAVKYVLANKGYCFNHFSFCNKPHCNAKANHLLMDGTRVCHKHSRNQKGAKSDRQLGQSGIAITEVKSGK